jgi:hypothetical protein
MAEIATLDRRAFVGAVAVLAGCTHSLINQSKIAESFILDPDWTTYRPVLRDLIRIILPLDDPHFPKITLDEIETRLIAMFPLENEQRFLGLQRTLTLFEQVDLFPIVSSPLLLEEEKARDGDRPDVTADERAYREFAAAHAIRGAAQFTKLPADAQGAYLKLWHDSAFIVKRAFHSGMKTLVMMTVYSDDVTWPAIGYAGPLV